MKLIAAIDSKWGIGKNGKLLTSIPDDMRFFKETTQNHLLIMGYKTLVSLPNSKPLTGRLNVVLSNIAETTVEGAIVCNNINQLLLLIKDFSSNDIIVIGGGLTFYQLLPYCDTAYITKMQFNGDADAFMPNLDENSSWKIVHESEQRDFEGIKYSFVEYSNIEHKKLEFKSLCSNMSCYFKSKEYIDINLIDFENDVINYEEEKYLVELRDILHAFFRPIEYGFNSTDILHYFEEKNYLSYSFEQYLKIKRYIAVEQDFEDLFKKYNPNNNMKTNTLRIYKNQLDLFEKYIDSFSSKEQIIEKFGYTP